MKGTDVYHRHHRHMAEHVGRVTTKQTSRNPTHRTTHSSSEHTHAGINPFLTGVELDIPVWLTSFY